MQPPILTEAARTLIYQAVLEAGRYFEVLITDVDFTPQADSVLVTLAVCCERSEKAGSFEFRSMHDWAVCQQAIRGIVGDWTLHL